jgi:hypothetical protein
MLFVLATSCVPESYNHNHFQPYVMSVNTRVEVTDNNKQAVSTTTILPHML